MDNSSMSSYSTFNNINTNLADEFVQSVNISDQSPHNVELNSGLVGAFVQSAKISAQNELVSGFTWNGDINFSAMGLDIKAAMLELDQHMVTPKSCLKDRSLDTSTLSILDKYYNKWVSIVTHQSDSERAKSWCLMFRYLFYVRSVRVAGKKSRLLFYYLFSRLHKQFPATCCALLSMVPEFGYFGDLDNIIDLMGHCPDIVTACEQVYIDHINSDCLLVWGKPLAQVDNTMAQSMNIKLKTMTIKEIREFIGTQRLSLAAKWFKREGKHNSRHRYEVLTKIYFPNGGIQDIASSGPDGKQLAKSRLNYCNMVFRNVLSALSQCIVVGEQMMCETDLSHRTWSDIPMETSPAKFITKYRKALANEHLTDPVPEHQFELGNRHPTNGDRVVARQNLIKTLLDGKLKGATQDIDRLSKIIYSHVTKTSSSLTLVERKIISTQWSDLVTKVKQEINDIIAKATEEAITNNKVYLDPRNMIPVVDTSGSMASANVQDVAIGLGILASELSSMPGCMISFSDKPEVFHLNMSDKSDVFDRFLQIIKGPTGLNTNIDATYRVLLNLMITSGVTATDFALLYLTDGQFDSQVNLPKSATVVTGLGSRPNRYQNLSQSTLFQQTFIGRLETAFKEMGYNLPRTVFWNLNCTSPGFPATSTMKGVQMVSGYSQTLMVQVFTGDYNYEVQEDGSLKVSTDPWVTFLKALCNVGYDPIEQTVLMVGEGCIKCLTN
jgi:hypothetical protein